MYNNNGNYVHSIMLLIFAALILKQRTRNIPLKLRKICGWPGTYIYNKTNEGNSVFIHNCVKFEFE